MFSDTLQRSFTALFASTVGDTVIQAEGSDSVVMVAIGDDRTDDDLFRAMPPGAISVAVGPAATAARYRVESYRNVRQLLRSLVEGNPTVRGSELRQAVSA